MKDYVVYDGQGSILRTGKCPAAMLEIQATGADEFVIEGMASDDAHYVDTRTKTIKDIPPKTTNQSVFNPQQQEWVDVVIPDNVVAANAVAHRNRLLSMTDWTQLPDVPLVTKELWVAYRQMLRDITAQPGFPRDIVWPVPPA